MSLRVSECATRPLSFFFISCCSLLLPFAFPKPFLSLNPKFLLSEARQNQTIAQSDSLPITNCKFRSLISFDNLSFFVNLLFVLILFYVDLQMKKEEEPRSQLPRNSQASHLIHRLAFYTFVTSKFHRCLAIEWWERFKHETYIWLLLSTLIEVSFSSSLSFFFFFFAFVKFSTLFVVILVL